MNKANYPIEVVTNLDELMRFEYKVAAGSLLPNRTIYSILVGRHAAKMRGRGLDFEEVRLYVPGDDIRHIDWKVTARDNHTYSKVFNEEKERPTFTLIDQSSMMFFGSQQYVKSVTAAHVAALSAFFTIKRGDRFGGIVFDEEGYDYIQPRRSKASVQHFLQLVSERNQALSHRKEIKNGANLLNEMLRRMQTLVTHDYVVTVITDALRLDDESRRILRSIAYHNDVILVHVEDPMDSALPDGKLVLTNGRRQLLWNNNRKHWGEKYTNAYEARMNEIRDNFRRYGIPVSVISTATSVEEQITQRMGERLRL